MILNALGLDYEKIFEKHYSRGKFDKILRFFPNNLKQVLNVSLIAGIVYFLFGWVEIASYAIYFLDSSSEINWSDVGKNKFNIYENYSNYGIFILIKTISVISFSFFMRGFVLVGSYYKNHLVEFMAFLMIIINVIFEVSEIVSLNSDESLGYFILISESATFGVIMILFGIGILRLKIHIGNLSIITGVLEIITGICFATVFMFVIGLFTLFPLVLLEILVLYKVVSKIKPN